MHRILPSLLLCVFLSLPAMAGTLTWTGAAGSSWSASANWAEGLTPQDGDSLVFPASAIGVTNNDVTGLDLAKISVGLATSTSYTFTGNAITLSGGITPYPSLPASYTNARWNISVTLSAAQTFGSGLDIASQISLSGKTLSLSNGVISGSIVGPGDVASNYYLTVNGSVTARIIHYAGVLEVNGSVNNVDGPGVIAGTGKVGRNSGVLRPGAIPANTPNAPDPHSIGALAVSWLQNPEHVSIDLNASTSDRITVASEISLISTTLELTFSGPLPSGTREYVIVSNEGTGAVWGGFDYAPEGSLILATNATSGAVFRISYRGGDGNDITLTTVTDPKAWIGKVDSKWSTDANWSDGVRPRDGDRLAFITSTGIPNRDSVNDIPGLRLQSVEVFRALSNKPFTMSGEAISVSAGVHGAFGFWSHATWSIPLVLANAQTFRVGIVELQGPIDTKGNKLTLELLSSADFSSRVFGGGQIVITGSGIFNIRGNASIEVPLSGQAESLRVFIAEPAKVVAPVAIGNGIVGGLGTFGPMTLTNGASLWPSAVRSGTRTVFASNRAILTTGPLTLVSSSLLAAVTEFDALAHDRIRVLGPVTLSNATLHPVINSDVTVTGQSLVIVDNDGTDAINGTFNGLPEGALVSEYSNAWRITYRGGDGNDIALTTLPASTTQLIPSKNRTVSGEAFPLRAIVRGAAAPGGKVTFSDGTSVIGTAIVDDEGAAVLTLRLRVGAYSFSAEYSGSTKLGGSRSSTIPHTVEQARSNLRLSIPTQAASSIHVQVSVEPEAPATGGPTGVVTISALDQTVSGTLTSGHFTGTFSRGAIHDEVRIQVVYSGDGEFAPETLTTEVSLGSQITVADHETVESSRDSFVEVRIHLSSPAGKEVRLDYETMDLTATAGNDYLSTTGTLIFEPGVATKTIVVPILADGQVEDPESFRLVLRNAKGAYLERSFATITIKDRPQGSSKRRGVRP